MRQNSAFLDRSLLEKELSASSEKLGEPDIYNVHGVSTHPGYTDQTEKLSDRELQAALDLLDVAFEKVDLSRIDNAKIHLQLETQKTLYEFQLREHRNNIDELHRRCDNLQAENVKLKSFLSELHLMIK